MPLILNHLLQKLPQWTGGRMAMPPATEAKNEVPLPYLKTETAETYRSRLIRDTISDDGRLAEAHYLIRSEINTLTLESDREHSILHEVRYLQTYKMTPSGPGDIADIGGPTLAQRALRELKHWDLETLPILSIDYETAPLPYNNESLDGVLFCEVLEHFINDPLHCLIEINRILRHGGFLVLTTPNAASWFAIYQALQQRHPNRWPVYGGADPANHHHIHAREYLVSEVIILLEAAGFEITFISTKDYGIDAQHRPIAGFCDKDRGETIYCAATKTRAPQNRQVTPIYLENIPYHA